MALEDQIDSLEKEVEEIKEKFNKLTQLLGAAFGDDRSMEIYRLESRIKSNENLIEIYRKDMARHGAGWLEVSKALGITRKSCTTENVLEAIEKLKAERKEGP